MITAVPLKCPAVKAAHRRHLETHTRSQTPHFMSYPMDMTWILYFLAKCHIHVISMSYLFFKKDIFGYDTCQGMS